MSVTCFYLLLLRKALTVILDFSDENMRRKCIDLYFGIY